MVGLPGRYLAIGWNTYKLLFLLLLLLLQELPKDTPIERPWIAEMYAIALGAAQMGVHHRTYRNVVMHPPGAASALNKKGNGPALLLAIVNM